MTLDTPPPVYQPATDYAMAVHGSAAPSATQAANIYELYLCSA
jgi:hypothetical protein